MKFFEYTKTKNTRKARILGIPMYHVEIDYTKAQRKQTFLGGLFTTFKSDDIFSYYIEKNIKFLGFPIIKRCEDGQKREYRFLNIPFKKLELTEVFKKKYLNKIDKKHDNIYILTANSGETYLFLTHVLDVLLKKEGSKNPLIIATKQYHVDLINLICPDISHILIKGFTLSIKAKEFKIDNFKFCPVFPYNYFAKVEKNIKEDATNKSHYFNSMLEYFNIKREEITMKKITPQTQDIESLEKKAKEIGLNLDNFIFIAPEAVSCELIEDEYWINLINQYKKEGYDIFLNLADGLVDLKDVEYKTTDLTFTQAFILASKAKKIVSLRSGLTEFLLQTNTKMDVLYTKFKFRNFFCDMGVEQVLNGFGMKNLPDYNKEDICEVIY